MKEISNNFQKDKYLILRNVIPKYLCDIVIHYAKFQAFYDFTPETDVNAQVPHTHSRYADFLMESFLLYLQPLIEESINRLLLPTYSYYRLYKQGDKLEPHIDRNACEISATLAFGWPDSPPWPFKFSNAKDYSNQIEEAYALLDDELTITVFLEPGDALVYAGPQVKHWREPLNSASYVQAFFHYVYVDGPNSVYKFDGRDAIGIPKISPNLEYLKYSDWMKALLSYLSVKKAKEPLY